MSARIARAAGQVSAHHCEPKRLEPDGEAPPHPEPLLQHRRDHLGEILRLVVEDVPEAPALGAPAAGDPALVLRLDELAPGVVGEEALEARHRPAGQAGARQEDRVVGRLPSASAWASAFKGASTRPKLPQRQAARLPTRPTRGSPATAAPSAAKAAGVARASKWISARASEAAATRVRASSAASSGRSWARITKRSFIGGRRLPSDIGYRTLPGKAGARPA